MSSIKEKERLRMGQVKLLHVEDNEIDAQWVQRSLKGFDGAEFQVDWVDTLANGLERLGKQTYDVIISDLKLPDGFGLEVFDALYKSASHTPILLITGTIEEETVAIEALQKGAQDYLLKGKITPEGLLRSITYALERHKLLALRDRFVNMVSHEIRSPLTVLREAVAQLHEGLQGPLNDSQKKSLDMALRSITRLDRTTTELLDLARMEVGKIVLKKESFDLGALAEELVQQLQPTAVKKNLKISCKVKGATGLKVLADKDAIARVFINLLGNALKFTQSGIIEVAVQHKNQHVECSVRDTGIGIAPEDLPKVFNKFEQFGKKGVGPGSGNGLGLSICREIIALHHGEIGVTSQLGKGSRFTFTLPKN